MSRIKVDRITDRARTGEPLFPNGVKVVGLTSLSNVVAGIATFENVSIGGTLTYEDVTNVDSTGIVTAKSGIKIGSPLTTGIGASLDSTGNAQFSGIVTASSAETATLITEKLNINAIGSGDIVSELTSNSPTFTYRNGSGAWFHAGKHPSEDAFIISDGANTTANERLRIGSAGQIGIGGANYGTAGQVLTSAGSGSAPSWSVVPPGGNTFTGIASGSIANNKAVQICHDGKVMAITQSVSAGTPTLVQGVYASSGELVEVHTAWNPRDSMIYQIGVYTNNQLHLERMSATTGTGAFTSLGGIHLNNNVRKSHQSRVSMCYDTGNNHLVVFYNRDSPTDGVWQSICTPSGSGNTALTTSSDTLVSGGGGGNMWRYVTCCYEPTQGKIVLLYIDDDDSSKLYMLVGSTTGSAGGASITWGSSAVLIDGNNAVSGANGIDICSCGNSRVLFSWSRNDNTTWVGAATITSGDGVTDISSSFGQLAGNGQYARVAWDRSVDKGISTYGNQGNSNNAGKTRLVTLGSSNALTLGTELDSWNQQWGNSWLSYNAKIRQVVINYKSGGVSGYTKVAQASINGSTISWANNTQINNSIDSFTGRMTSWNAADFSQNNSYGYISIGTNNAGANRGYFYTVGVAALSSSLRNYNHYVGFAQQAVTDGQTATINTYGNNITTLTGLTTSSLYYVQGTGDVGTTADGALSGTFPANTPVAGTALNYTTLLIKDPRISPNSY